MVVPRGSRRKGWVQSSDAPATALAVETMPHRPHPGGLSARIGPPDRLAQALVDHRRLAVLSHDHVVTLGVTRQEPRLSALSILLQRSANATSLYRGFPDASR
jgi:hypothetical protein